MFVCFTLVNWCDFTNLLAEVEQFPLIIFVLDPSGCLSDRRFLSTILERILSGLLGTHIVMVTPHFLNQELFLFIASCLLSPAQANISVCPLLHNWILMSNAVQKCVTCLQIVSLSSKTYHSDLTTLGKTRQNYTIDSY